MIQALETLGDALEGGDDGEILHAISRVEDGSLTVHPQRAATTVRYVAEPESQEFTTAGEYVESLESFRASREDLLQSAYEYLAADGSRGDVMGLVGETLDRYDILKRRSETMSEVIESTDAPAILTFDEPNDITVLVHESITTELKLSNVGSRTAREVVFDASPPSVTNVRPSFVDSISSGGAVDVRVNLTPKYTGFWTVTVSASTDLTGDTAMFELAVFDRVTLISRAKRAVSKMIALYHRGSSDGRGGSSVRRQLEQIERRLQRAAVAVERNAPRESVEGELTAAIKQLRSVSNRLENHSVGDLDPLTRSELVDTIRMTIDSIEVIVGGT